MNTSKLLPLVDVDSGWGIRMEEIALRFRHIKAQSHKWSWYCTDIIYRNILQDTRQPIPNDICQALMRKRRSYAGILTKRQLLFGKSYVLEYLLAVRICITQVGWFISRNSADLYRLVINCEILPVRVLTAAVAICFDLILFCNLHGTHRTLWSVGTYVSQSRHNQSFEEVTSRGTLRSRTCCSCCCVETLNPVMSTIIRTFHYPMLLALLCTLVRRAFSRNGDG